MKNILLLLFLLHSQSCVALWSPINWLQSLFYDKQFQAIESYKNKNYEQSLIDFHELMNNDPYNVEYNYNVGDVLYKQQKYSDAKQAFTRAVDHARKSSKLAEQAYFNIGNSCYQLEQWYDAVHAYEQVLEMNEDNESAYHNLQLALYKLKEQQMKDQQQKKQQNEKEKSQEKNQEKSEDKNDQCQNSQSDGDDEDQGDNGKSEQKQGQPKNKPGSEKNETGQEEQGSDGDNDGQGQGNQSEEKSQQQSQQQSDGQDSDQQKSDESNESEENNPSMSENDQQESDAQKSSKNKLQDSGLEKEKSDDAMQDFDQTQGLKEDMQQAGQEDANKDLDGDEKKEVAAATRKKPELKNELQDQYESKASDDDRLNDYHASVMKSLEDLEEKVQKHIIKNKVAMQGSGQNGKKGW